MQAYDRELLENNALIAEADSLQHAGFISSEQNNFIDSKLPSLSTQSNQLIRAGMFILACVLFSSCCGVVALFSSGFIFEHYGWIMLVYSIFGIAATEFIVHKPQYFANGIDDAFVFCTQLVLIGWVGVSVGSEDFLMPVFVAMVIAGVFCCVRYVDSLAAFLACVGLVCATGDLFMQAGDAGRSLLPFGLMSLGAAIYYLSQWLRDNEDLGSYYFKSINVVKGFGLALFYLAGNYMVVREGRVLLLNTEIMPGSDIPLAWLFYAFTVLVPVGYIYFSLIRKDRIMLWAGIFSLSFSIFTIRYYHHIIPAEWALVIGGLVLLAITWFSIHKLKGRTSGLTYEADRLSSQGEILKAEYILVVQNFGAKPAAVDNTGLAFGGGDFGGGGAGDSL